jgi:hypothetical protein
MLGSQELIRLDGLITRFDFGAARSILVDTARPCVSLCLAEIPSDPEERASQAIPLGASRMGGTPDLPADMTWPVFEEGFVLDDSRGKPGYAGFLLQIALEDMPRVPDGALPHSGQLYVFEVGPSRAFNQSFLVRYSAAAKSDLRPTARPAGLPCAAEPSCFEMGAGFALSGVLGIDFTPCDANGMDLYRRVARAMDADDLDAGFSETFSAFAHQAQHPDAANRAASGYPRSWWNAGRLYGALGRSLDGRVVGDGMLEPLLTIESDAAPIQLRLPRGAARPWTRFDDVAAAMTI